MEYKNISATPLQVNNKAKILMDFKVQPDKQLLANQPDTVVADEEAGGDEGDDPRRQ